MRKPLQLSMTALAMALGFGSAHAFETFNIVFDPASVKTLNVSVTGSPAASYSNLGSGQFKITPTGGSLAPYGPSFLTFCVELTEFLINPALAIHEYQVVASTAQVDSVKLGKLGQLYTMGLPVGADTNKSAAFQAAVWEIVYENSGNYDFALGNAKFTPGSVSVAAMTQAQGWLDQIDNNTAPTSLYSLSVLHSPTRQDYLVAVPVPEPEAYLLALAALGILGVAVRRRADPPGA